MSAETVALVKALSEGDAAFEALFLASDSASEHVFPSASAAQALLGYGDVDVYSARADRLLVRRRLSELVAAGRADAAAAASEAAGGATAAAGAAAAAPFLAGGCDAEDGLAGGMAAVELPLSVAQKARE
jgi:hypothetical protein